MSKKKFRIGISPCPNDTWIFGALVLGKFPDCPFEFDVSFADVQSLNEEALAGDFDLLKISFGTWLHLKGPLLLNVGGAMGYGCGPLLLSTEAAFQADLGVNLPGKGTTATLLFKYWAKREGINVPLHYAFFDEIYRDLVEGKAKQGVAIHECRFTWEKDGLHLVQDLGAYWEINVHAPIPLGGIILHEKHSEDLAELEKWILRSIEWAENHEAELLPWIQTKAQISDIQVVRSHISTYVNRFSKNMGEEGHRAVQVLRELSAELNQEAARV